MIEMQNRKSIRVACVDLLFCWPPQGGADVDLFHVLEGLSRSGIDVKLFVPRFEAVSGRGIVDPEQVPFPCSLLSISHREQCAERIIQVLCNAVDLWKPDIVFLAHGYDLKFPLALALRHYPLIGRYYAHEMFCARDAYRFKGGEPCPYNYMDHPEYCRRCALASLAPDIKSGRSHAWLQEYLLVEAYKKGYHATALDALNAMSAIIVYNTRLRDELSLYKEKVRVIPGGVSPTEGFSEDRIRIPVAPDKKIIFMPGRVEDPAKGLSLLIEAGARLLARRDDFHILATHFDPMWHGPFFSSTGWLSHGEVRALYERAALCVVPSLWQEPFGLVAVEAMMAGVAVCAADCGGLRDIVVQGETGLLFSRGDVDSLVTCLNRLLDDDSLRRGMGESGRCRALSLYTWDRVIDTHYLPLIESLVP